MTAENETPDASYQYDSSVVAPPEVIQLWIEVGNGLDKNQTGTCPLCVICSTLFVTFASSSVRWVPSACILLILVTVINFESN
jgi:hypothetical protein